MAVNSQELERITVEAYNEFYEKNKELFKRDPQEYWHQASEHKQRRLQDYKLKNGAYLPDNKR